MLMLIKVKLMWHAFACFNILQIFIVIEKYSLKNLIFLPLNQLESSYNCIGLLSVKSDPIRCYPGPHSFWMRENIDQNSSKYVHFSGSVLPQAEVSFSSRGFSESHQASKMERLVEIVEAQILHTRCLTVFWIRLWAVWTRL